MTAFYTTCGQLAISLFVLYFLCQVSDLRSFKIPPSSNLLDDDPYFESDNAMRIGDNQNEKSQPQRVFFVSEYQCIVKNCK